MTTAKNKLPLEIDVKQLCLDEKFLNEINSRLVLIYTGITRLAKDLLLNVLRNWYGISKYIYDNVEELVKNGFRCAKAVENGKLISDFFIDLESVLFSFIKVYERSYFFMNGYESSYMTVIKVHKLS